jgi:hypothetical protein
MVCASRVASFALCCSRAGVHPVDHIVQSSSTVGLFEQDEAFTEGITVKLSTVV